MKTRIVLAASLSLFVSAAVRTSGEPAQIAHDRYGGWTALKGKATGFFHTEQIAGNWWLVTPDGHAVFSKGVGHPRFRAERGIGLDYSPYERAVAAKYGTQQAWADATARRLKDWAKKGKKGQKRVNP
jgi:hypothetical protein